jgi:hypothetical protein
MSSESSPNINEKLEVAPSILPSALEDLKSFENFIKNPNTRKILDEEIPEEKIPDYVYEQFCILSEENNKPISQKAIRKFTRSLGSVKNDLSKIDEIKIEEEYRPWLGYKINGGFDEEGSLGRLYVNPKVEYASGIFEDLVENLQNSNLSCDIKIFTGDDERDFSRVDKIVIYFNGGDSRKIYETLHALYSSNGDKFNTEIPRFTRQLKDMPGIGFGEEPVFPNKSFSEVRSMILSRVYYKYRKSNYDENFDFVKAFQDECPFFQVDSRDPSTNRKYFNN